MSRNGYVRKFYESIKTATGEGIIDRIFITGNGNSSKEQVAAMLQTLLSYEETPKYLDATDGLAPAVCHHFQGKAASAGNAKKGGSWKAFVSANPGRVSK